MLSLRLGEMKLVNNVSVRVFCKPEDDENVVLQGLHNIIGFSSVDVESQKLQIKKSVVSGFEDDIKIFEFFVDKPRHVNVFLNNILSKLSFEDKQRLLCEDNRLDDNLDFFLRFSKPLILEDSFELTDSGDCFHIKLNLAVFPKKKEFAKDVISKLFS